MSQEITMKQKEAKRVTITVSDNGNPADLSNTTLFLGIKHRKSDADCCITKSDAQFDKSQAGSGVVSIFFNSVDLDQEPGPYVGELKIVFPDQDGTIEKTSDIKLLIAQSVTN
jgi:hypothetical protein